MAGPALLTENSIERVVAGDLCLRCGACAPVCPVDRCITLGEDLYPRVDPNLCIECGVCLRVCPGESLDIDHLKGLLDRGAPEHDFLGGIHQPFVGYALDPVTRQRAAAGGFVTQLLVRLLEEGEIDGAVVAGWHPEDRWRPAPQVARTPEAIRAAAGSKYTAVPIATVMDQVIGKGHDRYAVVGISCQVHSLRLMMRARPHLQRKVRYVIGLFCSSMFDEAAATDLLRAAGVEPREVEAIEYRAGEWPGVIRARTKDGASVPLHRSNYKDGAYNYLTPLYTQPRCWQCFDWGNELADLATGDPWGRGEDGGYVYPDGTTLLLPRTTAGWELMEFAIADDTIWVEPTGEGYVRRTAERMARVKLRTARHEMDRRRARGEAVAAYDRSLPPLSRRERWQASIASLPRLLGRNRRLRYLLLRFLLSPAGLPFVWLRQLRKYGIAGFFKVRSTGRGTGGGETASAPAREARARG